jgi:PAS domain S-box-containing protein
MVEEEYNRYWKAVVNTITDGLMVVDPEGEIVTVNTAMEQITGYSRDELVGQRCSILNCDVCSRVRARGREKYCELFKKGAVERSKCLLRKKDNETLPVLKDGVLLKDSNGAVVGGVCTFTDLSQVTEKEELISRLRRELSNKDGFYGILGKSPGMQQVFDLISSAANSEAPVVIYGETGTGKELVAAAIHRLGSRRKGPFIKVNCAALNESLLESELFGHVKGSFTGADHTRVGRFEAAHGGDIFLDEIGDLPLSTQVKLLRVLQEKEIEKVGDHRPIAIDVRIIAATNKNLEKLMSQGRFRDDLYYRIGVIPIYLPPLRDRREDIPLFIDAFMNRIILRTGKHITGMNREVFELFINYDWPGNVRELINVIEYAFVLCPQGEIMPHHLPGRLFQKTDSATRDKDRGMLNAIGERQRLLAALDQAGGKKGEAARILGISRVTLWKRLKKHDLNHPGHSPLGRG